MSGEGMYVGETVEIIDGKAINGMFAYTMPVVLGGSHFLSILVPLAPTNQEITLKHLTGGL